MTITICPASDIAFDVYLRTFNTAYSDYYIPLHMDAEPMRRLIQRDAVDLTASRVALENGKPIGVGMLAIQEDKGWIGGLGIVPAYRRKGIGRLLTQDLLDSAQARGLKQVQLEVIEKNIPARQLYDSLGFKEVRRLLILERQPRQQTHTSDNTYRIDQVFAEEALSHYERLHSVPNPWQRRYEALQTLASQMDGWMATAGQTIVAYAVGWAMSDTIRFMDIAGQPEAVAPLLNYVHGLERAALASIINMPAENPIAAVMQAQDYQITNVQYEMVYRFE